MSTAQKLERASLVTMSGRKPFNDHFWADDGASWWLDQEYRNWPSRFSFGYIALADGRFVAGICVAVWEIENNRNCYNRPVVYPTKEKAIRADCARMIRLMRASRKWNCAMQSLQGKQLETAINWARRTCAKACLQPEPRPVVVAPILPPIIAEPLKPQLELL